MFSRVATPRRVFSDRETIAGLAPVTTVLSLIVTDCFWTKRPKSTIRILLYARNDFILSRLQRGNRCPRKITRSK